MIITFEEYNLVVNGLRQQLLLHSQRERELLGYIKHREEANERAWEINNKAALRIDELTKVVDELGQKLSNALAENLQMAATNLSLLNDIQKAREDARLTCDRATRIEQQLANLKLKLKERKL